MSVELLSLPPRREAPAASFFLLPATGPDEDGIYYPESDDEPMADNTLQLQYINYTYDCLVEYFRNDPDVFIAADLFWYPVKGDPDTKLAPDVMVAVGRPKGHRRSYQQWHENGQAPQFVMEILSPGNRPKAMGEKSEFYYRHGVQEYLIYDPDKGTLTACLRSLDGWMAHRRVREWKSRALPLITFRLDDKDMILLGPTGEKLMSHAEIHEHARQETHAKNLAERQAKQEAKRAEREAMRANQEALRAQDLQAELARIQALLKDKGLL